LNKKHRRRDRYFQKSGLSALQKRGIFMLEFTNTYLKRNYDNFEFFDHECGDKRIREIYMRTRRCLKCPGFEQCRMHPSFWLAGESDRLVEDRRILDAGEEEPIVRELEEEELEEEDMEEEAVEKEDEE
jgi:hypothetical protein